MENKKYTCALIFYLFLLSFCCGQSVDSIVLDFSSEDPLQEQLEAYSEPLKYGKVYQVKVKNINRRLYKVETTISKSNNNTSIPAAFASIVLPTYINFSKLIEDPNPTGSYSLLSSTDNPQLVKASVERLDEIFIEFQKLSKYQNDLKQLHFSCGEEWSSIKTKLFQLTRKLISVGSNDRAKLRNHLHDTLTSIMNETSINLKVIRAAINSSIEEIETDMAQHMLDLKPINLVNASDSALWIAQILTNDISNNKIDIASLKNVNNQLDKALRVYSENVKTDLVGAVLNNFDLINESNYSYSSHPFKVDADEVEFSITITAKAPIACDSGFEHAVLLKKRSKGKMKVDFSTGFMASFGNDRFFDQQATFRKVSDSTSVVDIGPKPSALLSIGAFAHIYKRTGNKVNFALSPGVSTTTNLETVNLHLGGSLLCGFRDRLIITTGLTFRQATLFDDTNISLDVEHPTGLLPDAPPTKKLFPQTGVFFGLSYNLSRPKAD